MLTFDKSRDDIGTYIKPLVEDLARSHASRYPLHVNVVDAQWVEFLDRRFSKVASLEWVADTRGMHRYRVSSFRLRNPKYHLANPKYHAKFTNDPKKALKILKEIAVPFSPVELATSFYDGVHTAYHAWKFSARENFATFNSIGRIAIGQLMEDILAFKNTGMPYTRLSKYMDDSCIAAYQEMTDRDNSFKPTLHVYINEDGMTHVVDTNVAPNKLVAMLDSYEQLPQNILEKLSILKITEAGTFVGEVGIKQRPGNSFWVYE